VTTGTAHPRLPGRFGRFDRTLAGITLIILLFGLLNLWSALQGRQPELASRQIMWLGVGGALAALVAAVDYRRIARASYFFYALGVGLLAYVDVAGKVSGGARSWLHFGPIALQPAELMKPLLVLALARHIQNAPSVKQRTIKHLFVPIGLVGLPTGLVAIQPDFGTAVIYSLIFVTIMLTARFSLGTWVGLATVAGAAVVPIWKYALYDYQRGRILAFINPALDRDRAWQPQQAMHAVGSGRLFGKGYLEATQVRARSLPALWTDFPFAVFAEEWGFAGSVALIGAYAALVLWLLRIARDARDRLGAIICIGSAAMIFWQCVLNLGMVIGVLPVTGLTLPLISYGGSSLLTTLVTLGLCLNVSMRRFG
jgi:rod shape determining protein RodA